MLAPAPHWGARAHAMMSPRSGHLQACGLFLVAAACGVAAGIYLSGGGTSEGTPLSRPASSGEHEVAVHHPPRLIGSAGRGQGSRIGVSPDRLDVGSLAGGSRHEFSASVYAVGEAPVAIGQVYASCGCLRAQLEPAQTTLMPGDHATLRAVLIVPRKHGRFEDWIRIVSSDGKGGTGVLRIVGTSVSTIACSIEHAGDPAELVGATHGIRLILDGSPDLPEWRPTRVISTRLDRSESVEVEHQFEEVSSHSDAQGRQFQLALEFPPVRECVRVRWRLKVETSVASVSTSAVVSYSVLPPVRPDRTLIVFGEVGRPGVGPIRVRFLGATRDVAFAIREARMDSTPGVDPDFLAEAGQDERGSYVDVAFVGPTDRPRTMESHLLVESDRSDSDVLRIPTRAFVSGVSPVHQSGK